MIVKKSFEYIILKVQKWKQNLADHQQKKRVIPTTATTVIRKGW